jgi:multisubunit Na+/H+ antiporter MnhB subunit
MATIGNIVVIQILPMKRKRYPLIGLLMLLGPAAGVLIIYCAMFPMDGSTVNCVRKFKQAVPNCQLLTDHLFTQTRKQFTATKVSYSGDSFYSSKTRKYSVIYTISLIDQNNQEYRVASTSSKENLEVQLAEAEAFLKSGSSISQYHTEAPGILKLMRFFMIGFGLVVIFQGASHPRAAFIGEPVPD